MRKGRAPSSSSAAPGRQDLPAELPSQSLCVPSPLCHWGCWNCSCQPGSSTLELQETPVVPAGLEQKAESSPRERSSAHTCSHTWPDRRWGCVFCHCHGNGDCPPLLFSRLRESIGSSGCGKPGLGMVGEQSLSLVTEGDTCTGNSAWHHLGPL